MSKLFALILLLSICSSCKDQQALSETSKKIVKSKSVKLPEMCGGIAGIQCPSGYLCNYEGDYPDASGSCLQVEQVTRLLGEIELSREKSLPPNLLITVEGEVPTGGWKGAKLLPVDDQMKEGELVLELVAQRPKGAMLIQRLSTLKASFRIPDYQNRGVKTITILAKKNQLKIKVPVPPMY